ncbi:hypothetical protein ONZ45_g19052 [Pleurotus djamor]|nr:hypothetical protein ONZ45_g19052 [Pleurotus djamor]
MQPVHKILKAFKEVTSLAKANNLWEVERNVEENARREDNERCKYLAELYPEYYYFPLICAHTNDELDTNSDTLKRPVRGLFASITASTMSDIVYRQYGGEQDLPHIMALVQNELSEPYVVYTYRYFLHQWPHLAYLAYPSDPATPDPVGVIVCKQSMHRKQSNRGYIAMLSVSKEWRKRGIASALVKNSIDAMKLDGVDEVVLETEFDNSAALSLYESLGFIREKRLYRFYLNGKDAFRLVLPIPALSDSSSDNQSDDTDVLSTSSRSNSSIRRRPPPYRAIRISPYSDDEDDYVSTR